MTARIWPNRANGNHPIHIDRIGLYEKLVIAKVEGSTKPVPLTPILIAEKGQNEKLVYGNGQKELNVALKFSKKHGNGEDSDELWLQHL